MTTSPESVERCLRKRSTEQSMARTIPEGHNCLRYLQFHLVQLLGFGSRSRHGGMERRGVCPRSRDSRFDERSGVDGEDGEDVSGRDCAIWLPWTTVRSTEPVYDPVSTFRKCRDSLLAAGIRPVGRVWERRAGGAPGDPGAGILLARLLCLPLDLWFTAPGPFRSIFKRNGKLRCQQISFGLVVDSGNRDLLFRAALRQFRHLCTEFECERRPLRSD
jgi:hypothetical protein